MSLKFGSSVTFSFPSGVLLCVGIALKEVSLRMEAPTVPGLHPIGLATSGERGKLFSKSETQVPELILIWPSLGNAPTLKSFNLIRGIDYGDWAGLGPVPWTHSTHVRSTLHALYNNLPSLLEENPDSSLWSAGPPTVWPLARFPAPSSPLLPSHSVQSSWVLGVSQTFQASSLFRQLCTCSLCFRKSWKSLRCQCGLSSHLTKVIYSKEFPLIPHLKQCPLPPAFFSVMAIILAIIRQYKSYDHFHSHDHSHDSVISSV